jgi:NAD(P)-dependent dehydrogenase (short-subunit alcohol dehydrogenase family)
MTRAANGVGKSIAIDFARAGYIMMINDVVERELKQTVRDILSSLTQNIISENMNNNATNQNNHISYFAGDISKEEVSIALMEETIKRFGTIN